MSGDVEMDKQKTNEILTNYKKTKVIIRALTKYRLTACEYAFCLYLIDQLYGYRNKDKTLKTFESVSYQFLAKALDFKISQVKKSIKDLQTKKILLAQSYATKHGNAYHFNAPGLWNQYVKRYQCSTINDTTCSTINDTQY